MSERSSVADLSRDITLGIRLLRSGGRAGLVRASSLALGVGVSVLAVLTMLSIPGVIAAQNDRLDQLEPVRVTDPPKVADAPLRAALHTDVVDGRFLDRLVVAETGNGPEPQVPSWLPRFPSPGEMAVSPALAELIAIDPIVAARFDQTIVARVADDALTAPDHLVAVLGVAPEDFDGFSAVTGIGNPGGPEEVFDPRSARVMIVGALTLIVGPLAVLIAVSARLSARSRERRLSALRLIGLSARRTRRVLAVETGMVALVGASVALLMWIGLQPVSQRVGIGSLRWWAADISLPLPVLALVTIGVMSIAVGASLLGANPAVEHPFSARRDVPAPHPRSWKLGPIVFGAGLLTVSLIAGRSMDDDLWLLTFIAGNFATAIGLMLAVPHLARICSWALLSFRPSPPRTLAARRLAFEPTAIGRVIAGMLVIVFAAGFSQALLVQFTLSYGDREPAPQNAEPAQQVVIALFSSPTADIERIRSTSGIVAVAGTRQIADPNGNSINVLLASCQDADKLVELENPDDCNDTQPQRLREGADTAPAELAFPVRELLDQLDLNTELAEPLQGRVAIGIDRRSSRSAGDLRISPSLLDQPTADAVFSDFDSLGSLTLVAVDADTSFETAVGNLIAAAPTALVDTGASSATRGQNAPTMAALLTVTTIFTMIISLGAAALAATDRALERRRIAAHLAAIGVPATVQRKAEVVTTAAPLILGLLLASALGALSGTSWLRFTTIGKALPWEGTATILATGVACTALAATVAALGTTTTAHAGQLRTE